MALRAAWALTSSLSALALGCGPDLPPRLPSTAIHDRTASRVDLVDFVISDRERANKVRALYLEIERATLSAQAYQAHELEKLGAGAFRSESEMRDSIETTGEAEIVAVERVIRAQLAIRRLTTPEEFARLDAIK